MSEYQFYEFQAVERPLSREARAELRSISSRAEITATSLINEYHWGDFKGDPEELVKKHFDAFLYHANWGTRRFLFRVPLDTIVPEQIEEFRSGECVGIRYTRTHALIDFDMHFDGGDAWFADDDDDGSPMAALLPLRQAIMAGDMRPMYVAWLASVYSEGGDSLDENMEPPVPPGLNELTPAMVTLAEFLCVNRFLFEAAARASPRLKPADDGPLLEAWIESIPETEKNALLVRACEEDGFHPGAMLMARFRAHQAKTQVGTLKRSSGSRRTVGQLIAEGERLAAEEQARENARKQREAERQAQEAAAARERHLKSVAGNKAKWWKKADDAVSTRQQKRYDEAIEILRDLFELAERSGRVDDAQVRLAALCKKHARKENFVRKVQSAKLGTR